MERVRKLREALTHQQACIVVSFVRLVTVVVASAIHSQDVAASSLSLWLLVVGLVDALFLPSRVRDVCAWQRLYAHLASLHRIPSVEWYGLEQRIRSYWYVQWVELAWYIAGMPWLLLHADDRFVAPASYWVSFAFLIPVVAALGFLLTFSTVVVMCLATESLTRPCLNRLPASRTSQVDSTTVVVTINSNSNSARQPSTVTLQTYRYALPPPADGPGQGMTAGALARLPTVVWSPSNPTTATTDRSDDEAPACAICLVPFAAGDVCRRFGCEHTYHRDCIDKWLRRAARCPLCNADVEAPALPPPP